MGNQGHNELNGIYRSRQEEVQDEIMNSPPRDDEDPSLDQNHDSNLNRHLASPTVQTGLSSSFTAQALSAPPSVAAMGTISQIGQLLDQVVTLANSAREHFKQGEHSSSSSALGDIQRSLAHIGELGSQSLATVQATPLPVRIGLARQRRWLVFKLKTSQLIGGRTRSAHPSLLLPTARLEGRDHSTRETAFRRPIRTSPNSNLIMLSPALI